MKLSFAVIALCCGFAIFAACKKNEIDNESPKGKLLEAGKWQISGETATVNYMGKDTTVDLYSQMEDCDKDDFVLYASNGKGTIDENVNKCAKDNQVESFDWALLNNDTRIALVDANPDTFDLDVSGTQMLLKITKPNSSNVPVLYVYTYKNIR